MFFHRANSLEDDLRKNKKHSRNALDTITVATQLSVDRIDKRLYDMVREWNGPMSIAVYVRQYSDLRRVRIAQSSALVAQFFLVSARKVSSSFSLLVFLVVE